MYARAAVHRNLAVVLEERQRALAEPLRQEGGRPRPRIVAGVVEQGVLEAVAVEVDRPRSRVPEARGRARQAADDVAREEGADVAWLPCFAEVKMNLESNSKISKYKIYFNYQAIQLLLPDVAYCPK